MQIEVKRSGVEFMPDPSRIIARFLFTGEKTGNQYDRFGAAYV
jgi:hypothetical protein